MGSDRARVSFDADRRWRAIVAQQGRVTLEADWNEAQAIAAAENRAQILDIAGPAGTPDDGYRITQPPSPQGSPPPDLVVGSGTFYVGGVRVTLDEDTPIGAQPDWQDAPAEPAAADQPAVTAPPQAGSELVYLLLREQEVSAVEDHALREVGLGGPDTAGRTRILQRILRHPTGAGAWLDGWADAQQSWAAAGYALDAATMRLESTARLQVSFVPVSEPTPCQPGGQAGYLGAENQLIRVQICDVQGGSPVLVWGYDNASFLYRVVSATADPASQTTTLTLASTPVDTYHQPQPNQVVEVLRSAVVLPAAGPPGFPDPSGPPVPLAPDPGAPVTPPDAIASPGGVVAALTAAGGYDPGAGTIVLGTALAAPYDTTDTAALFVRIWQGQVTAPAGTPVTLGDTGVQVTLTQDASPPPPSPGFHAGDCWTVAVRPSTPVRVYPERLLTPQPPDGPLLWACPLALVSWNAGTAAVTGDARRFFSTLATLTRDIDYVAVLPEDVGGGAGLQALVDSFTGRPSATIRLLPGTYTLPAPLVIGPGNGGLTIDGSGGGATLTAGQDTAAFLDGMIVVNGASGVTLSGITIILPVVPFTIPAAVISILATQAQSLVQNVFGTLNLSFGIQAVNGSNLSVERCAFFYPQAQNILAAGIFAATELTGLLVEGCQFLAAELTSMPWADLEWNNATTPPYPIWTGILQIPVAAPAGTTTTPVVTDSSGTFTQPDLRDARIASNVFDGVTVAVLALSQLGAVAVDGNTVRNSHAGFWFMSYADVEQLLYYFEYAEIVPPVQPWAIPFHDPVFLLASVVGRGLTYSTPTAGVLRLAPFTGPARPLTARPGVTPGAPASAAPQTPPRLAPGLLPTPAVTTGGGTQASPPATFTVAPADPGTGLTPRLEVSGNQVDAVLSGSYTGACLFVMDLDQTGFSSALVAGNRFRGRAPVGPVASVYFVQSVVTGNVVSNEAVVAAAAGNVPAVNPFSLAVQGGNSTWGGGVVVTGNTLLAPPSLPARPSGFTSPLDDWQTFNTVFPAFTTPWPWPPAAG